MSAYPFEAVFLIIVKLHSGETITDHATDFRSAFYEAQWWRKQTFCASAGIARYVFDRCKDTEVE